MNVNLELCTTCHCMVESSMRWQHDNWHQSLNYASGSYPCHLCGAVVHDAATHDSFHKVLNGLYELVDRMTGSVKAHLEYMANDG